MYVMCHCVNRVAMPGRTEVCFVCMSCVTESVNRVAMPGRTEVCGCVCHVSRCLSTGWRCRVGRRCVGVYVMCHCVCQQGGDAG